MTLEPDVHRLTVPQLNLLELKSLKLIRHGLSGYPPQLNLLELKFLIRILTAYQYTSPN
jgi:hypothetical protein